MLFEEPIFRKYGNHKGVKYRIVSLTDVQERELKKKLRAAKQKMERESKRRDELGEDPSKLTKAEITKLGQQLYDAIGRAVPDVDPIEYMIPVLEKMGITDFNTALDIAAKEEGFDSYDDMLISSWDSYNEGVDDEHKVTNPWR